MKSSVVEALLEAPPFIRSTKSSGRAVSNRLALAFLLAMKQQDGLAPARAPPSLGASERTLDCGTRYIPVGYRPIFSAVTTRLS